MTRPKQAQKARVATSVALIVIGVLLLASAATSAGESGWRELEPAPERIDVDSPRAGDGGVYALRLLGDVGGRIEVLQANESVSFLRQPDETILDRHGAPRKVMVIDQDNRTTNASGTDLTGSVRIFRDGVTGEVVQFTTQHEKEPSYALPGLYDPVVPRRATDVRDDVYEDTWFHHMDGLCAWDLPSGSWDLSEPVSLFRLCQWGTAWTESRAFTAIGVETVGALAGTVVLRDSSEPPTFLWVDPSFPYPARFVETDALGILHDFTLVERVRGTAPVGPSDSVPAPPRLEFRPYDGWGLEETGFRQAFSLEEALALARNDPTDPFLRDYLASHPDAYIFRAISWGEMRVNGGGRAWEWDVYLTDGTDNIGVWITAWEGMTSFSPTSPTYSWPVAAEGSDWGAFGDADAWAAPPRNALPAQAPTLASAGEWWKRLHGDVYEGYEPNAWGLEILCPATNCSHVEASYWVGYLDYDVETNGHPSQSPTWEQRTRFNQSWLIWGNDGVPRGISERTHDAFISYQPLPAPSGLALAAPPAPQDERILVEHDGWSWPRGPVAVGAGLLALLVGVGYALWPAIKQALLLPAYSRLLRPAALAHPARAELLSLIDERPGIHFQEVRRRVGRGPAAVLHHLRALRRVGLIRQHETAGYTCFFPAGWNAAVTIPAFAILKSEGARGILRAIAAEPGLTAQSVAERAKVSAPTVNYHLKRLVATSLVGVERRGGSLRLTATNLGAQALQSAA